MLLTLNLEFVPGLAGISEWHLSKSLMFFYGVNTHDELNNNWLRK